MKKIVKEAIEAELKYIDDMPYGDATTTARIMHMLGYNLGFEELMDVEFAVYDEVEKTRDYVMDKSSHYNKVEGLPFNLDFVKKKK